MKWIDAWRQSPPEELVHKGQRRVSPVQPFDEKNPAINIHQLYVLVRDEMRTPPRRDVHRIAPRLFKAFETFSKGTESPFPRCRSSKQNLTTFGAKGQPQRFLCSSVRPPSGVRFRNPLKAALRFLRGWRAIGGFSSCPMRVCSLIGRQRPWPIFLLPQGRCLGGLPI